MYDLVEAAWLARIGSKFHHVDLDSCQGGWLAMRANSSFEVVLTPIPEDTARPQSWHVLDNLQFSPPHVETSPTNVANSAKLSLTKFVELDSFLDEISNRSLAIPVFALRRNTALCDPRLYAVRTPRLFAPIKRTADLTIALSLGMLFLPILLAFLIAIRVESAGPGIFAQTRVGKDGNEFRLYKLRSMTVNVGESGPLSTTVPNDLRVTRVGRLVRRWRIDELPQLWNVIVGEMSLIGPRPEVPETSRHLSRLMPGFDLRTQVRPGITGWAQVVVGFADCLEKHERRLEHDLYYVRHHSISLDLRIAIESLKVIITPKGTRSQTLGGAKWFARPMVPSINLPSSGAPSKRSVQLVTSDPLD